jgi:hypothetical protein
MTSTGKKFGALAALTAATLAAAPAAVAQLGTVRLDNWFFYQDNYDDSARAQWRPRLFVPYDFGSKWTFTQRVDFPFYYTDASGPRNPDGDWKFGGSDALVEEIFDLPAAGNMRLRSSLRLVFPTGGKGPFGSDQWQLAPGFGGTWRYPEVGKGLTISPYARYFYGFNEGDGITTKRSWNVFPTATFGLGDDWSVALWPEQGISYNLRSDKWFVPLEAMFTKRLSKEWEYSIGGAAPIVNDDRSYRWLLQGRVTYYLP